MVSKCLAFCFILKYDKSVFVVEIIFPGQTISSILLMTKIMVALKNSSMALLLEVPVFFNMFTYVQIKPSFDITANDQSE